MIINQANLGAIYKGFKTIFQEAFAGVQPHFTRVATEVPSSTREEAYPWLGSLPRMREWAGERVINNLKTHGFTIKNKDFELSVEVDRNDIEDDTIGIYTPMFSELGRATNAHPDELTFDLLKAGFTTACYDGQYFFDTDHPVGDASVSNFGGGAGNPWFLLDVSRAIKPIIFQRRKNPEFVALDRSTDENVFMKRKFIYGVDDRKNVGFGLWQLAYASKDTLDPAHYSTARAAMMSYTNDAGRPLGVMGNLLVVGPSNEGKGREILMNERDAAGATNLWRNTAELLVCPWLP